ncbi:hypothetical protein ACTTAM_20180 (plasmid) [Rhodobacter capsulatus]|uniref:hypothetical protein n=1 Tax=Rhodobacter capsulatus TaxID=1061 RepID=UPI00402905CD
MLDGIGGAAERVGGIADLRPMAPKTWRRAGRGAEPAADTQERELGMALRLEGFERGDNKLQIVAVAAAAVALILLMK